MVPTSYLKPYKTFDEQISLLEDRGIVIEDKREALVHLKRLGYYRLSAYWYPFRRRAADHREGIDIPDSSVVAGVIFSDIVTICDIDGLMRNVLLEAIEAVEVAVRVAVAYQLGKYGPMGYLDKRNLGPGCDNPSAIDPMTTDFEMFGQKQRDMVQSSKEEFAKHFQTFYNGECPIWAAIELWDFGTLSRFFQMMTKADRDQVAIHFGLTSSRKLANWLECVNDLRNVCAHHSRLNRRHFPKNPSFPRSPQFPQFRHLSRLTDQAHHRLYPLLCVLVYMLDQTNPEHSWRERLVALVDHIEHVSGLKLADYAIPDSWHSEAIWQARVPQS
jgi:abortive infection bacteriophage resistance protein